MAKRKRRTLGHSADEHRSSAESSIGAIHRSYDEAIKSTSCATMHKRLMRFTRLDAMAGQQMTQAIGHANFTDPLYKKYQDARMKVLALEGKYKRKCLIKKRLR